MDRFLKELGLFNADVSASSVRFWRLANTLAEADEASAQERAGYPMTPQGADRLWRNLGYLEKPRKQSRTSRRAFSDRHARRSVGWRNEPSRIG